jgi:hypothetical protein
MLRYLSLLLILVTLTGCSITAEWFGGLGFGGRSVKVIDSTEVSRVVLTYSEKLRYTKGLDLEDSVIFYENRINRIRLDFNSMYNYDVWEARAMLVDVVEEFLDRINGNAKIYPYLSRTPITASNLEIYIRFPSFYNSYVDLYMVGFVTLKGGITTFLAGTALDCDSECWQKRSEYYFQSRNFVNFKRQGEALYKPIEEVTMDKLREEGLFYTKENADSNRRIPLNKLPPAMQDAMIPPRNGQTPLNRVPQQPLNGLRR